MSIEYDESLEHLRSSGRFRELRPLADRKGCRVTYRDKRYLNLTSNDYLGLAGNTRILRQFYGAIGRDDFIDMYGLGAASSRLLTGDIPAAHRLEEELMQAYGRPAALLFNSGYHANIGILPALLGKGDLIVSDKLNHASIHDGMQLSRAEHRRYRHCDYDHLQEILEESREKYGRIVVVSESVFSMDGDVADLPRLVALKRQYGAMLYVDEAHAVGLYGDRGLGKAEEFGVIGEIDLLVGTFGKAYASVGAFVLCNGDIRDYLINHSRSLIFTTALPPVVTHWNLFIFRLILQMGEERQHLAAISEKLRRSLVENDLKTCGSTNIVPVMIGDNQRSVDLAAAMQNEGYLIFPVRPPTVPEGTSRFRLSLTADMLWQDLDTLAGRIRAHMDNR
ncbi:MAG: 8-amino-7-oxononanoate synthase [Desulfocapsaceae bacterium]|nr:8-amino-7-oxononanoate synthase [Desulfocapsaceae bacterium]